MPRKQPRHWKIVYDTVEAFRKENLAPVDTMGCSCIAKPDDSLSIQRFHTLLGLILSSQTRDEITSNAVKRLQKAFPPFSPKEAIAISEEELGDLIKPVSFYKRKSKYILSVSKILLNDYHGDIPSTLNDLLLLPGVGPKMANLCMQIAWNKIVGIGVDTHVHRICNRLGWVKTKYPEMTQKVFVIIILNIY